MSGNRCTTGSSRPGVFGFSYPTWTLLCHAIHIQLRPTRKEASVNKDCSRNPLAQSTGILLSCTRPRHAMRPAPSYKPDMFVQPRTKRRLTTQVKVGEETGSFPPCSAADTVVQPKARTINVGTKHSPFFLKPQEGTIRVFNPKQNSKQQTKRHKAGQPLGVRVAFGHFLRHARTQLRKSSRESAAPHRRTDGLGKTATENGGPKSFNATTCYQSPLPTSYFWLNLDPG